MSSDDDGSNTSIADEVADVEKDSAALEPERPSLKRSCRMFEESLVSLEAGAVRAAIDEEIGVPLQSAPPRAGKVGEAHSMMVDAYIDLPSPTFLEMSVACCSKHSIPFNYSLTKRSFKGFFAEHRKYFSNINDIQNIDNIFNHN